MLSDSRVKVRGVGGLREHAQSVQHSLGLTEVETNGSNVQTKGPISVNDLPPESGSAPVLRSCDDDIITQSDRLSFQIDHRGETLTFNSVQLLPHCQGTTHNALVHCCV